MNPLLSTFMLLALKMSAVKSKGNPYVSYNLNAIEPGKILFLTFSRLSFKILIPLSNNKENFSSSFF